MSVASWEDYWDRIATVTHIFNNEQYYGSMVMDGFILALAVYFVRIKRC